MSQQAVRNQNTETLKDTAIFRISAGEWVNHAVEYPYAEINKKYGMNRATYLPIMKTALRTAGRIAKKEKHADKITIALDTFIEQSKLPIDSQEKAKLRVIVGASNLKNVQPFDRALELVKSLSRDYDIYILTNSRTDRAREYLARFGLEKIAKRVFISEEIDARKETGEMFLRFLEETRIASRECIMIGDDPAIDSKSKEFGIKFCYVEREKVENFNDYDFKISDLRELK